MKATTAIKTRKETDKYFKNTYFTINIEILLKLKL